MNKEFTNTLDQLHKQIDLLLLLNSQFKRLLLLNRLEFDRLNTYREICMNLKFTNR